jgi:hypothetical protein
MSIGIKLKNIFLPEIITILSLINELEKSIPKNIPSGNLGADKPAVFYRLQQ